MSSMIVRSGWMALLVAIAAACDRQPSPSAGGPPPAPSDGGRGRVVFLGTSLTAGLGLDPSQAYPALLQRRIDSAGLAFEAVNAGVSGETSAGALRRIDWLLRQPAAVLVIETGANDGLRGLDVDSLRANIQAIIDAARRQTPPPRIVLVGMRAPPNNGLDYARRFRDVYPALAKKNGVPLVPFLLEGVAGRHGMNQADMIHPTAAGQARVAETVWPVLEGVLLGKG
ncbi:MAG TPA: arylesterase [Gemmatimonadales bacterium]|nr:arylesterase [Gemmatimonadales bacterium]